MATQEDRRRATRTRVIAAAGRLFRKNGIPATTTQAILDEAGISRGAMYHHFASREDVVAAVYEHEAAGAIERALARRVAKGSAIDLLLARCFAWLDEIADPRIARILIVDGPAALGWERCRAIETAHSLRTLRVGLEAAAAEGDLQVVSMDLVVGILNAALTEAALSIARSKHKRRARAEAETTLRQLVAGFSVVVEP